MSLLALIPARGGSKGVPRKNIKSFAGKPLIDWTIRAASMAKYIDRVVVSTDDEEIASMAKEFGAEVPFMRPAKLAADQTPGMAPVLHAIKHLPKFDWVLLLQPTSPLRTHYDIDAIWEFCQSRGADSAVSVTEVQDHPYFVYKKTKFDCIEPLVTAQPNIKRRQDLPEAFKLNGAMYLAKVNWLLEHNSFIGPGTLGFVMPFDRSVDLDTQEDWCWAEYLIGLNND